MSAEPLVILLVEDDQDHAELIQRSLAENDVANRLSHVSDGQEALDYLFRRGEFAAPQRSPQPHLILLDLRLPKMDGLEVLKQIKMSDRLPKIPVVVLTTSAAEQDKAQAYDLNVNSYVVKPIDSEKFRKLLHDLDLYWLVYNQLPNL